MYQQNQEVNGTSKSQNNGVTLNHHSMFQSFRLSRQNVYE